MTKIDIISGFLGAGKTTLIKKLISEAYKGEKTVLIENEFGEIGIDGGFLKDAGIEITEMNSGCICCSLVGDFGEALRKVLFEFAPDRIVIEPSGVGKLSDVIRAVEGVTGKNATLGAKTVVVDAKKAKMYIRNFGEFFCDQVEHADTVILSHTAGMSEEKLATCIELLREHNAKATIVTTEWDGLTGSQLLAAMEQKNTLEGHIHSLEEEEICPTSGGHHHHHEHGHEHHHHHDEECGCSHEHHHHDHHHEHKHEHEHHHEGEECCCGHHHEYEHHHHADEVFSSIGKETAKRFTAEFITCALKELENEEKYGIVLRAKGMVAAEDGGFIHFDYVPGEPDVRSGSPDIIGRICVIGSRLNETAICELFGV